MPGNNVSHRAQNGSLAPASLALSIAALVAKLRIKRARKKASKRAALMTSTTMEKKTEPGTDLGMSARTKMIVTGVRATRATKAAERVVVGTSARAAWTEAARKRVEDAPRAARAANLNLPVIA